MPTRLITADGVSLDGPHTMHNDPYIDVEYYVDALDGRDWKIRATLDTETGSKWVTFAASPQGQEGTPYDEPGEVPPELKSLEPPLLAALSAVGGRRTHELHVGEAFAKQVQDDFRKRNSS